MTKYVVKEGEESVFHSCLTQGKWTDLLDYSSDELDCVSNSNGAESNDDTSSSISGNNKKENGVQCCLISHDPLDKNCLTLPCNHTFNFLPLYEEVLMHNLREPKIKCPYCRTIHNDTVLPHVKLNKNMVYRIGVNQPVGFCIPFHTCQYIFKQKNTKCDTTAYHSSLGTYCPLHQKTVQIQLKNAELKKEKDKLKDQKKLESLKAKEQLKLEKKKIKEEEKKLKKKQKEDALLQEKIKKQKNKEQKKLLKQKLKEEHKQNQKLQKLQKLQESNQEENTISKVGTSEDMQEVDTNI
jgi:hypothetical protein